MKDELVFAGVIFFYLWYSLFYVRIRTKKYLRGSRSNLHPEIIFKKNIFGDVFATICLSMLLYGSLISLSSLYSLEISNYDALLIVVIIMFSILLISTIYHLLNFNTYVEKAK